MTGRDLFSKASGIITLLVLLSRLFPKRFRLFLLVVFRNMPGLGGVLFRYILLKTCAKSCGNNVVIKEAVILYNVSNLIIGNNVSIHPFCYIEAKGGVSIGNNVSIAHGTSILSVNHTWNDISIPIKYNDCELAGVNIEDDVWIGCGCRVLAGTTIHTRCVVAAGAVVTKNVMSNTLVGGIPARAIKNI